MRKDLSTWIRLRSSEAEDIPEPILGNPTKGVLSVGFSLWYRDFWLRLIHHQGHPQRLDGLGLGFGFPDISPENLKLTRKTGGIHHQSQHTV